MKKDDNTTNYSARLVCEKCGYVFGLKEVAYIEHGFSQPWDDPRVETKCYNEIYPKYCPKCKREAQQISYGNKLGVYCSKDKEEADIAIKKRTEEEIRNGVEKLKKLYKFDQYFSMTPATSANILAYCNGDVNATKCCEDTPLCWDCEAIKAYCSIGDCPHKDSVSPKYFEKYGLYLCAVFSDIDRAKAFASNLFASTNIETIKRISLSSVTSWCKWYNGYIRMHKSGCDSVSPMLQTNEARCGWSTKTLKNYGIAIDFEKDKNTQELLYCVYLPSPKYFDSVKEGSK